MKQSINKHRLAVKALLFMGLLTCAANSYAQRSSVISDPQLGVIKLTDEAGVAVNADDLEAEKVIMMQIPVISHNHGEALPAGSCKIKIGLGSKLALDPTFSLNNAGLGNYFTWTSADNSGQVQITGELVNALPANVTYVNVAFKVKATVLGRSTITANFLVTNHNSPTVLSDEDGSNNAASLSYKVEKLAQPAVVTGNIQPYMYPNPVTDVKTVMIQTKQGEFKGAYTITISDVTGKNIHTGQVQFTGVTRFNYPIGNMAAGKYVLQLRSATDVYTLKFEKL